MRLRILLDAFLAGGPATAPAGQAAPGLDVLDVLDVLIEISGAPIAANPPTRANPAPDSALSLLNPGRSPRAAQSSANALRLAHRKF